MTDRSKRVTPLVQRLEVHAAYGSGRLRIRGDPPNDWPEFMVEDEARQLEEFLAERLPARTYEALARKMNNA